MRFSKSTKSLIYTVCQAIITIILIYFFVRYVIGYKGPLCHKGGCTEGFQQPMWPGPPYISGGAFKVLSRYNIDDRYELMPYNDAIEEGSRVFMKVNDIPSFLEDPPQVKVTVVISNSDEEFDDALYKQIEPYVTRVFAINCSASKANQIPIGFRDDGYTPHKDLTEILNDPNKSGEKTTLCLVNFLVETNGGERQRALHRFTGQSWATIDQSYLNYGLQKATIFTIPETIQKRLEYYARLKATKFVVCPPGRGMDTHRVYETLFFGGIPIIKTSFLDPMYKKLGGCWIVKDWSDVTEEACAKRWASRVEPQLAVDASLWLK